MNKGFCTKLQKVLTLIITCTGGALALFAENGVSMTVLQDDPYFLKGAPEVPQDQTSTTSAQEQKTATEETPKQTYNPDDEDTFYNAQNWVYGPDGRPIPMHPEDAQEEEPNAPAPSRKQRAQRATSNIALGWAPQYALPLFAGGLQDVLYMRDGLFPYMVPLGLFVNYDLLLKQRASSGIGLAIEGTLNYYTNEQDADTIQFLYFALNALFLWEKALGDKNTLAVRAGLGAWFAAPTFNRKYIPDGLREEATSVWMYPSVVVNASYFHLFTARLYAEAGIEASPVLDVAGGIAVIFFPVAVRLGVGWQL